MDNLKKQNKFKRAVNGQPVNLYVETLIVTDLTVFEDHKRFAQSTDTNVVFQHMRIYFAHLINGVKNYLYKNLNKNN